MKENDEDMNNGEEAAGELMELQELPEQEIARLRFELEEKTKEAGENRNRFLRACADLENYRKRSEKEKTDAIGYANESIIEDVLLAVDNFERALAHANGENSVESLKEGVKLTLDRMYATLKKYGLQEIKSVGVKFDPSVHHAISHEDSTEAEPETVVREFQKGYFLKGRLLRAAMVAVAKRPEVH
ncbi:MAG: nucleotide exchange factor GrpE [Deltaproteobacteria bacterium]|nr:nucleotide exchange factor GrpE [Deltaproteobacteria bacterium]